MLKKLLAIILTFILCFTISACNSNDEIATINGETVDEACFNYYFSVLKAKVQELYGENSWQNATLEGKPALEYVRERAIQSAIEDKIVTIKAEEDGINLTGEDEKNIAGIKKQWINQYGGEKAFLAAIEEDYGLTGDQFDYMVKAVYYRNHVMDKYVKLDESDVIKYYEENVVKVKHILIATVDLGTGMPLSEEDVAAAKQKVDEVQAEIEKGTDFDSLVADYTQDQNVFYYVGKGFALNADGSQGTAMVAEFEDASFTLGVEEISNPVESAYGYHIIKRYDNDDAMFEISKDTMSFIIKSGKFVDVIDNWKKDMVIVVNEDMYNNYK